jgi:hypothetical protein
MNKQMTVCEDSIDLCAFDRRAAAEFNHVHVIEVWRFVESRGPVVSQRILLEAGIVRSGFFIVRRRHRPKKTDRAQGRVKAVEPPRRGTSSRMADTDISLLEYRFN